MSYMVQIIQPSNQSTTKPKQMSEQPTHINDEDDKPPILKSWNQLYVLVLIMHALIITLFYLFTQAYS